jgi:hypothetical protein
MCNTAVQLYSCTSRSISCRNLSYRSYRYLQLYRYRVPCEEDHTCVRYISIVYVPVYIYRYRYRYIYGLHIYIYSSSQLVSSTVCTLC